MDYIQVKAVCDLYRAQARGEDAFYCQNSLEGLCRLRMALRTLGNALTSSAGRAKRRVEWTGP